MRTVGRRNRLVSQVSLAVVLVGAASLALPASAEARPQPPPQPLDESMRAGALSVAVPVDPKPFIALAPVAPNVYSATMGGPLSPAVAGMAELVYVPNSASGTVDIIDPATFKIVQHYWVGAVPHHIAPAWDLQHLYVDTEAAGSLSVIDPHTGHLAGRIPVADPYNLYFTPDGSKAIVVAEVLRRLDFRDPHTWKLIKSVRIPGSGVDHMDFSADGSYLLVSTEYSGWVVKVDIARMAVMSTALVGGFPIDIKLSPDGAVFYVANQSRNGVSLIDPIAMREIAFIPTGRGAHGLAISRDAKSLYVSNRYEGSISVIDFSQRKVVAKWRTGGSPDMLQVSPDGTQLWASGRFDGAVYVIETTSGSVIHRIRVGGQPHGLCYFPNVGRYSLGHNGVYR